MEMKRTIAASLAVLSLAAPLAANAQLRLHDPDAVKPVDPPSPPVYVPPSPPVYTPPSPPIYTPPSPPVYHPPVYPTGWITRYVYINSYGTRRVEYRTFSSGLRTIKVYGPKGKEKLKDVNCYTNTFRAPKNRNPFRFQYETVKAVCRF